MCTLMRTESLLSRERGKLRPFKKLKELPRYQSVGCYIGKEWTIAPDDKTELKLFTCNYIDMEILDCTALIGFKL